METRVTFSGDIPEEPNRRQRIETAIAEAFRGLAGLWKVEVIPGRHSRWWFIKIDGKCGYHRALLAGPKEHEPQYLHSLVKESLRDAVLLQLPLSPVAPARAVRLG